MENDTYMKYRLTQHKNERATLPGNERFGSIKTHSADGSETAKESDKSRGMRGVLVNWTLSMKRRRGTGRHLSSDV